PTTSSAPSSGGSGSAPPRGSRAALRCTVPSSASVPSCPLFRPARHDVPVGGTGAAPCLVALGRPPPRRHRVVALALAFAAAHRVIHGVHDRAATRGPAAPPPPSPGLSDRYVCVVQVAS